jgi:outer membrane biosynthesis protein TonB
MRLGIVLFVITALSTGCSSTTKKSEPEITGMDKEGIRQAIREHLIPIRHCYEKELKTKPNLSGKLVLEWDVDKGGKVVRTEVYRSVDPSIDACVADVIKNTKFPEPAKGQIGRIRFPFVFSPKAE